MSARTMNHHRHAAKAMSIPRLLLLFGMALSIPFLVLTVLNNGLAPWPLYNKNRLLLCVLTPLFTVLLLGLQRTVRDHPVQLKNSGILLSALAFFVIQG